jgi:hypothetical protein
LFHVPALQRLFPQRSTVRQLGEDQSQACIIGTPPRIRLCLRQLLPPFVIGNVMLPLSETCSCAASPLLLENYSWHGFFLRNRAR